MDYQTPSRNQKKKSPTNPSPPRSSSRLSDSSLSDSASIRYYTALANSSTLYQSPYESPYARDEDRRTQPPTESASRTSAISTTSGSTTVNPSYTAPSPATKDSPSTYSSSSGGSLYTSSLTAQSYRGNTLGSMSPSKGKTMSSSYSHNSDLALRCTATISLYKNAQHLHVVRFTDLIVLKNDKEQHLRSLRTHRVNTFPELRRIEKLFASSTATDVTEAMTSAWAHYVNSNNLLSELRGMTKDYPFSSTCLDAAKWKVIEDPTSTRSWNYCWLILTKIKTEDLIKEHARILAAKPAMWGGRNPTASGVEKLATACQTEWTRAVDQMLRQWATPPCTR